MTKYDEYFQLEPGLQQQKHTITMYNHYKVKYVCVTVSLSVYIRSLYPYTYFNCKLTALI